MSSSALATLLLMSLVVVGCGAERHAAPPVTAAAAAPPPPTTTTPVIVRFDFVVTTTGRDGPVETSFSLDLEEGQNGEMSVGTNAPIAAAPTDVIRSSAMPRQDLGLKVKGLFWTREKGVLLELHTEHTGAGPGPSAIKKVRSTTKVLLAPGERAVVARVDTTRDHTLDHFDITVTSTRLH